MFSKDCPWARAVGDRIFPFVFASRVLGLLNTIFHCDRWGWTRKSEIFSLVFVHQIQQTRHFPICSLALLPRWPLASFNCFWGVTRRFISTSWGVSSGWAKYCANPIVELWPCTASSLPTPMDYPWGRGRTWSFGRRGLVWFYGLCISSWLIFWEGCVLSRHASSGSGGITSFGNI